MIIPIDKLYEMSFHLIYLLKIQPSEVNELTIPESRSYIKYYDEQKQRERERFENSQNKNSNKLPSKPTLRKAKPRRR